ncbi:GroES-like protein [Xylariomycetidae sp. FL0641]|nr:GroES-like protein [Xylariomycetidae sp. FL0641]
MSGPQLPKTMKAARIVDFNKGYEVVDMPVPTDLGPNDILVQIKAAGYCHTDLQVLQGVYASAGAKPGLVGSHEPAGVVVAAGSDAGKSGIKVGDRVGSINTYGYCDSCDACKQGQQLCEKLAGMLGLTLDGGFAEYMKADARVAAKIPETIPWAEAAPLFCAGATVYGALLAVGGRDPEPGRWLAMIGIGGLGHLGIQYAKALGYRVVAIDNRQEAVDLATGRLPAHLRPDRTYVVADEAAQTACREELGGGGGLYASNPGVDAVVINAEAPHLVRFAQAFTRKGGHLCDVGLPGGGATFAVDPFALNFKEQTLHGRLICTPAQCQGMLELHARHGCRVHVEKTYPVDDINDMLEHYQRKNLQGRICMTF